MFCGGIRKIGCVLGMLWGGRWKMWYVFMSLCRGVLNTPHKRPIYGANDPNDRSLIRILVPCGAIRWGVCNTSLPCYPKNNRVRGMFCGGIRKIGCLWGMLWGGRWKTWCVFMPLGRNYPAQKVRGVCCFKKDATFAAVTTAVVDIFLK